MKMLPGRIDRPVPDQKPSITAYHIHDAAITDTEDSKVSMSREGTVSTSAGEPIKHQRSALDTKALMLITPKAISDAARETAMSTLVTRINKQAEKIEHTNRTLATR
jgi:hypothetical protein